MKIITIGDIHGRTQWKNINPKDYEKVIFIGDYVDSFDIKTMDILNNLADIISFKKDFSNKVILLIGNHDLMYMYLKPEYVCSGFKQEMQFLYNDLFKQNEKLFQVAYQYKNYLWTHAGVSNKWLNKYKQILINNFNLNNDLSNIGSVLNMVNNSSLQSILHEIGYKRGGWRGNCGGITWADKSETLEGIPGGLHQIVGHSPVDTITSYNKIMGTTFDDRNITYIDCLGKRESGFYELNI